MADIRKQLKKKDEELFEEVRKLKNATPTDNNRLYELSHKYVSKIIYDIVKDPYTTEDLTQEAYMRIYNNLDSLKEPEAFYVWAGRIATNLTFRYIQKNRHEVLVEADEEGNTDFVFDNVSDDREEMIPETVLMDREKQRIIADILDSLSIEQKLSVQYFYYEEMSVREIAETMGVSEGTVKSRLNYARKKIKDAVIEMDVKHGTRLYSLSALPVLMLIFRGVSEGFIAAGAVGAASAAATGSAVAGTSTGGASAAGVTGGAAASTSAGAVGAAASSNTASTITASGAVKGAAIGKLSAAGATASTATAASSGTSVVTGGISAFIGTTVGKVVTAIVIVTVATGSGTAIHHAVKTRTAEPVIEEEMEYIDETVSSVNDRDSMVTEDISELEEEEPVIVEETGNIEDAVGDTNSRGDKVAVDLSEWEEVEFVAPDYYIMNVALFFDDGTCAYTLYVNEARIMASGIFDNGDEGWNKILDTMLKNVHNEEVRKNTDENNKQYANKYILIKKREGTRLIGYSCTDENDTETAVGVHMDWDTLFDTHGNEKWNSDWWIDKYDINDIVS